MAKPFQTSSGDLAADRRHDYAEMLFGSGEAQAAAELMLGALELAPEWSVGWFRLGEFYEAAGQREPANEAWRTALRLDPDDHAGAALKLALAGALDPGEAPPIAFVEALFDQYAPSFDTALVGKLGYRVPELLSWAIAAAGRPSFGRAIDLGCGTGLMGERLRPLVSQLEGQDISAAMLKKAEARNIYDRLEKSDLQSLLLEAQAFDLVTAADVFMYVGGLDRVVAAVAAGLAPGGLFAFSVEKLDGGADFALRESRRYAHGEAYVRRLLQANELALVSLAEDIIRQDRNEPVTGLIVVAERTAAT